MLAWYRDVMLRRTGWAIATLLLMIGGGHAPGCAAPGLPLPPPEVEPLSAPDATGMVTVEGQATEDAMVFTYNEDLENGVITSADGTGAFLARVEGQSGDTITVWQRVGTDDSEPTSQTVP